LNILLDEDVPRKLAAVLPNHIVRTVPDMGWSGVKNGTLIKLLAEHSFELFITGDKNLPSQQNLADLPFALLILSAISWPIIRGHIPAIVGAVEVAKRGSISQVDCGTFVPRSS
jgi:hypothetical protein